MATVVDKKKMKGTLVEFGIEKAETGLFVSSISFDASCEKYEQQDHHGNVVGVVTYNEKMTFSVDGELPAENQTSVLVAAELELVNSVPKLLSDQPTVLTIVVDTVKKSTGRTSAATLSISGSIYPFEEVDDSTSSSSSSST